ncbi:MAG TPA: formate dehydrogenase accessory sulfurtransferase FdhD [Candidatus Dormibacteraeota bacterium]|nr:formate dehydrogenase accessory sulfurtransferase FdhD [Candidatus Dormibacteraeota bacterium]
MKAPAQELVVREWTRDGRWSDRDDAVVMEEPLQLLLNGKELSVVMRTPGNDIELALGLFFAEGIIASVDDVAEVRISAEAREEEGGVKVERSILESNSIDLQLHGEPRRRPQRSMLASSACGVCGAVMIDDLKHGLAPLGSGLRVDASALTALIAKLREGQGVFDQTGGLHAAGRFSAAGELVCAREDVGRHNAVDKVVGRALLDGQVPCRESLLLVSGRAGYEIVQKAIAAGIPIVAAVGAPSSLAVALAREFGQTLVGFLRDQRFNVYSAPERIA